MADTDVATKASRLVGFKMVSCLFPLSDTTGKELPPSPPLPGWNQRLALEKLGIREVPFDELNGNVLGFSVGLEFAISPLSPNRNHTLFHELGHIILGHTMPSQHADYVRHRGIKEAEADITSYLALNELGALDEETATHIRGHTQAWLDGDRLGDESIRSIFRGTDAILCAGRLAASDVLEPEDV